MRLGQTASVTPETRARSAVRTFGLVVRFTVAAGKRGRDTLGGPGAASAVGL